MRKVDFVIQTRPIQDTFLLSSHKGEGARISFVGLVRDHNAHHSGVTKIEYQCYEEMAVSEGTKILQEALKKFDINRVACVHRIGILFLQETAVRLDIGSAHRLAAIRACEYILDNLKAQLPIWKKEYYVEKGKEVFSWL